MHDTCVHTHVCEYTPFVRQLCTQWILFINLLIRLDSLGVLEVAGVLGAHTFLVSDLQGTGNLLDSVAVSLAVLHTNTDTHHAHTYIPIYIQTHTM